MNAWLLCVLLDRQAVRVAAQTKMCMTQPSEAVCTQRLQDWIEKAWIWEHRMGLIGHAVAMCKPIEEVSIERTANSGS